MNWSRVWAVAGKEWLEIRKNKMILLGMAFLPLIMVATIWLTTYFMLGTSADELASSGFVPPPGLSELSLKDALIVLMNDQYMFYLLLVPIILPTVIAAYSIIGEKENRSLEPLLATPLSTWELLIGKSIAAISPAVILGWLSFIVTVLGLLIMCSNAVFLQAVRPLWSIGMLVFSPVLALASTLFAILVSSKVNDVRAAQSIAALAAVIPIITMSVLILLLNIYLTMFFLLWVALITVPINVFLLWLTAKLFQRESILLRWK